MNKKTEKELLLSSWSIDNKYVVYILIAIFIISGLTAYYTIPKESFPEIKETKVYVSTSFPGNTAEDIEKLITTPLEDALKSVKNSVEITSNSQANYSIITIEFNENISAIEANIRVKDIVDSEKSSEDWPTFNGVKIEPKVFDLNFSEQIPILNVNIQGDLPPQALKEYAEILQNTIERFPEIKEAPLRGVQDKEIEIAVDIYKMTATKVNFDNVINAVRQGNVTISAGNIIDFGNKQTVRIIGEIESPAELKNFVVKTENGAVYLGDIAEINFREKDKTTFARNYGENVVFLDVKKRSGTNIVEVTKKIKRSIAEIKKSNVTPPNLKIFITNDQSELTLNSVNDLVNNIIFGVLIVIVVLMFFLGLRNSLFVGFAIPMSMFMSFMVLQFLGYTLNTMVLFALVMGLGMLVDNGIVVVENVYRRMTEDGLSRIEAAKKGVGEIAFPIIISTATTIAAFIPLGLWPGIMGEFMIYFPITLSIVLGSSLIVALIINSTLVSEFMRKTEPTLSRKKRLRFILFCSIFGILFASFPATRSLGSLLLFTVLFMFGYRYILEPLSLKFKNIYLVQLETFYKNFLDKILKNNRPLFLLLGTIGLFFLSIFIMVIANPKVELFPDNKPNQIIVYIEYPEGTSIEKTNEITKVIEQEVIEVISSEDYLLRGENFMVESAISQVGEGAGNPLIDGGSAAEMTHKGKISVFLKEFKFRNGQDSEELRIKVQQKITGVFPGVAISVEKNQAGPPTGFPISIELKGPDYDSLLETAQKIQTFIRSKKIDGIVDLRTDINKSKFMSEIKVDRKKAGELGVSAGQIGTQIRRSLFGEKAGVYKLNGEDYDINVRFKSETRYNTDVLLNQQVIFRDAASGKVKNIPIASIVGLNNTTTFSAIKHEDLERLITIYSSILPGYNTNEIVNSIKFYLKDFKIDPKISYSFGGEIEEQQKQFSFLMKALLMGIAFIILLLVLQFNSFTKPLIIIMAVVLSFIGVLLGIIIFNMSFIVIMTMLGIISLAGIVVNNGVVLIDYINLLKTRALASKQAHNKAELTLSLEELKSVIVEGGRTRLRPVILTAITTILGLIPLATGLNIDFFSLLSTWNPKIYIGGDNVIFWGPLAWTVIFGLTFATFLTLVIVPVSVYIVDKRKTT